MNAKQVLDAMGVALDALPAIRKIAGADTGTAEVVLSTVASALDAVISGLDGSASPQEALARVEQLRAEFAANDASADAALAAKFPR